MFGACDAVRKTQNLILPIMSKQEEMYKIYSLEF